MKRGADKANPPSAPDQRTDWRQYRFFRWMIGLGAVKATLVVTLIIELLSLLFAVITMTVLHRLSWMGVFISGALPLLLVPPSWYLFMLITEQLDATETRLRKSEERYRSILEQMNEAYVEIDRDGRLAFFNDSLSRITGFRRAELENLRIDGLLTPANARRLLRAALSIRGGDRVAAVYDLPITTREGGTRFLDVSFSLLRDRQNRWSGYHAVLFDVTEKITRERERKNFEQRLARAERMESLGIMAGGVAHDLNNILCGLVGYPDLLLLDCREEGELKSSLLAMKHSGEKATAVVQDLLVLSRRGLAVTETLNLNEVVGDFLNSPECAQLAGANPAIRVSAKLDPNLLNVEGSRLHLYKTVMNLVINSFEAITPPGTIRLATENRCLDRPLSGYDSIRPGEYVTLSVADSGAGISPEDRERIFEPFYTRKVLGRSGSGLGLAVVWGAVRDHQGYIVVDSEPGRGSSIELYFPASRREREPRPPEPEIADFFGRGQNVLVVDDLPEQRTLLSQILGRLGYRVHAVSSGEKALEFLERGDADLMILDMVMDPGMDGLDTFLAVRRIRPGLRVILSSGFSETDRVRQALAAGAGPYVKKPYRLTTLARVIHEALAEQRS